MNTIRAFHESRGSRSASTIARSLEEKFMLNLKIYVNCVYRSHRCSIIVAFAEHIESVSQLREAANLAQGDRLVSKRKRREKHF